MSERFESLIARCAGPNCHRGLLSPVVRQRILQWPGTFSLAESIQLETRTARTAWEVTGSIANRRKRS